MSESVWDDDADDDDDLLQGSSLVESLACFSGGHPAPALFELGKKRRGGGREKLKPEPCSSVGICHPEIQGVRRR